MLMNGVQQIKIACANRIFFFVIPNMPLSGNDILHDVKMLLKCILTADAIGCAGRSTPCHRNKQQGILRNRIIVVEYQLIPFMNVFKFHLIPHPESASCVSLPYGRASNPQKYVSRIYYTIFSTAFQKYVTSLNIGKSQDSLFTPTDKTIRTIRSVTEVSQPSGSSESNFMEVQVLLPAPKNPQKQMVLRIFWLYNKSWGSPTDRRRK